MNKSYIYKVNDFVKKLIMALIKNENFFKILIDNKDKEIKSNIFYLINKNWYQNFLKLLNYDKLSKNKESIEKDINDLVEQIIEKNIPYMINKKDKLKKNNEYNNIFNCILQSETSRMIKYYISRRFRRFFY